MFKNQRGFSAIEIVLVIIVIAALGFAGWTLWQTRQDDSDNVTSQQVEKTDEASEEPAEPEEVQEAEPATKKSHPSFATGQVSFMDNDDVRIAALINNSMREEPLQAIWVEYSKDRTELSKKASKSEEVTTHIAYNTHGNYAGFQVKIPATDLERRETYFYRAAGKTRDGHTIYGGVAAFNSGK